MRCFIGVGSNLGDRQHHLERAAQFLKMKSPGFFRASPVYSSPALVPEGAPEAWRSSFLNAVFEIEWTDSPMSLLALLKNIEKDLGREPAPQWAPRIIDLDILLFGENKIQEDKLTIPHPGIYHRSFVLDPLKHMAPSLKIPGSTESVLTRSRKLSQRSPLWMGILNLTPDSFSDGGEYSDRSAWIKKIELFEKSLVGMIDIGAESTRPGATAISAKEEWERLKPALEFLKDRYRTRILRPRISMDTRNADIAEAALELGADCINDVSGSADPQMQELLQSSSCEYVLMHSLSVPADPKRTLPPEADVISEIKNWAYEKLNVLSQKRIALDRVIFDPGLGFGKTAEQSQVIVRRINEFFDLPVRILVGHSRKSFIQRWSDQPVIDRDWESVGISLQMAARGVDILRVHDAHHHIRAHAAYLETMK